MTPEAARLLEASHERLADATAILGMGIHYVAAREAYLAAYGAAEALLLERTGRIAKTHRGLRTEFSRIAHGEPAIDSTLTRFLAEAYELKSAADLLVNAREMQRAGAGIRSLAEPFLDTTPNFAEIVFAILGVAAKLKRRRILERTARGRENAKAKGRNSDASRSSPRTSSERHRRGLRRARRSAALPAAKTSDRRRFRGWRQHDTSSKRPYHRSNQGPHRDAPHC